MLLRRVNPYNGVDADHPLVAYRARHVRGGRSPMGMVRFSRLAFLITALVLWVPMLLLMWLLQPGYGQTDYFNFSVAVYYALGAMGASVALFPLVDFFAVFFAVNSVRADLHADVQFDLLRVSIVNPQSYIDTRIALARLRAWRVFIFVWAARIISGLMLVVLAGCALVLLANEGELSSWVFNDIDIWFVVVYLLAIVVVFVVQLVAEPLWRLDMLTTYGTSLAARFEAAPVLWLLVVGGSIGISALQALLAGLVIFMGVGLYDITSDLLRTFSSLSYGFRDNASLLMGLVPYLLMPPMVWGLHTWIRSRRRRMAVQHIFRKMRGK